MSDNPLRFNRLPLIEAEEIVYRNTMDNPLDTFACCIAEPRWLAGLNNTEWRRIGATIEVRTLPLAFPSFVTGLPTPAISNQASEGLGRSPTPSEDLKRFIESLELPPRAPIMIEMGQWEKLSPEDQNFLLSNRQYL